MESSGASPDLRRRILEASVALVRDDGLGALSMREVARRAGVSHQAPYHYFPDRESILAAIAAEGFRRLAAALRAARDASANLEERLKKTGAAYVEFALESPAYFRVMFRPELVDVTAFPEAQTEGMRAFAELEDLVRLTFESARGRMPADEETWSVIQWSVVHGLACLMLDGPLAAAYPTPAARKKVIHGAVAALVDSVIPSLRGKKAPKRRTSR